MTGKYWEKSKAVPSGTAAYDETTWRRLWEVSDNLISRLPEIRQINA